MNSLTGPEGDHEVSHTAPPPEDTAVLLLFGATGSGKSSFANIASGKSDLAVGHGIKSCTQDVSKTDAFMVDGKSVVLVDFPGFDDSHLADVEILSRIADFLSAAYQSKVKISGLLYLQRITDIRFRGIDRRNLRMFREMCGTESLKNVVVVTNMWSQPPNEIELKREAEFQGDGGSFHEILSAGAQMVRHSEPTPKSAHDIIQRVLDKAPVVPIIAKQMVDDGMELEDTDAGRSLGEEITEALQREREEIERLQGDKADAARENNGKWQGEFKAEEEKANARSRALEEQIKLLRERRGAQRPDWVKMYRENQDRIFDEMDKRQQADAERVSKIVSTSSQPQRRNIVSDVLSFFISRLIPQPQSWVAPNH